MEPVAPRPLTDQERAVLRDVRCFWGPQNSASDVFIGGRDEAVLFVNTRDDQMCLMAVLTNLGRWRADGTLSKWDYHREIMGPIGHNRSTLWIQVAFLVSRLRALFLGWNRDA